MEQFHEYKRQTQQRETDAATRNHAFEEQLRQRENQVADIMAQLVDQQDFAQKLKAELSNEHQRSAEKQSRMEAEIEQRTAEKQDIARRLEHTIVSERKELAEAKEQYDRWREAHVHSLKQIQDEAQLKVAGVEKDKQLMEERLRGELADLAQKFDDGKKKRESLEGEIKNMSASQVMDIDQKFRGMKAEYESTLNMTESRYRDAVNREKNKLDTITSENDQLRKIISSDYRSPGIGSLTSTVE